MKNQSLRPQRNREKLLVYNSITSLVGQIASVICGFVLTRLILGRYGSETNGLVASITQFLGFISFLELGIGAVVKSALYMPLAEGLDAYPDLRPLIPGRIGPGKERFGYALLKGRYGLACLYASTVDWAKDRLRPAFHQLLSLKKGRTVS